MSSDYIYNEDNAIMFREEQMKKIVDLKAFKIEKSLKENGFTLKKDDNKNVKLLIKLKKSN